MFCLVSKGKRVEVIADRRRGVVSFIGNIDYNEKTQDEPVVGIFLDEEFQGDNNGTLFEKEYFKAEQNRGIFVPVSGVRLEVTCCCTIFSFFFWGGGAGGGLNNRKKQLF